jgi:hypothetical protein
VFCVAKGLAQPSRRERPVYRQVKDADVVETLVDDVRDGAHN